MMGFGAGQLAADGPKESADRSRSTPHLWPMGIQYMKIIGQEFGSG